MANYHVMRDRETGLWRVVREGSDKASGTYPTQAEAERMAKQMCANSGGGEVRIHGLDGKIRDSDTVPPGRDPNPPKDKKH
jgi:hypothetical protein